MATGSVDSWTGPITDIGPLYPFLGTEVFLVIVLLVVWIGWHWLQFRVENDELRDSLDRVNRAGTLKKVLEQHEG
jgi:hypothetical protein